MLKYRLITGPILIIGLLAIVWMDNRLDTVELPAFLQDIFGRQYPPRGVLLYMLGMVFAGLAAHELSAIFQANSILTRRWLTALAAMTGLTLSYSIKIDATAVPAIATVATGMILFFAASLLIFSQHRNVEGVVAAAGAVMFAMVYLGLMFGFLLAIRRNHSAWWVVSIVLITKTCDTGAYFTGRSIGKHKLIPWLSPGKTWEGLGGGIVAAMALGAGLAAASGFLEPDDQIPVWLGLLCGFLFAITGQFGDLTVSLFKRGAGLKDSSSMLPGLGGVLDVLDSPLMVAPVAFWLLELTT